MLAKLTCAQREASSGACHTARTTISQNLCYYTLRLAAEYMRATAGSRMHEYRQLTNLAVLPMLGRQTRNLNSSCNSCVAKALNKQ